ncbi:MAG: barstar family protein [Planctomycetota bacterium]
MPQNRVLDLNDLKSLDDFHDRIVQCLRFPPYYGRNLDAFTDCLNDFADGISLSIRGLSEVDPPLSQELFRYVDLLKELEQGRANFALGVD